MFQRIKQVLQKIGSKPGDINRVIFFLWFLTALGLLSLVFLASYKLIEGDWSGAIKAVGTGLFLAGAASVGGGLVGFLFGVPRHRAGPDAGKHSVYQPNTNLEQISDWLTKIIVGIGLTQFPKILEFVREFGRFAGPAFGDSPIGEIIAVCLLVHYSLAGFFQGFLIAYLWLPRAYARVAKATEDAKNPSVSNQDPTVRRVDESEK